MAHFPSETWLEMALDAVEAARQGMVVLEFERRARLLPLKAGATYVDRLRVLEDLVQSRIIRTDERCLHLGHLEESEWVVSCLEAGNPLAWKIAQIVDTRGHFLRKFDSNTLEEIGRLGEEAVMSLLEEALSEVAYSRVKHVSLVDDTLGYDILTPSVAGLEHPQLLEVKTSVRPGPEFSFFLSRNEFRVGSNNPNWRIVGVRIVDNRPILLGYFSLDRVFDWFPTDSCDSVSWASCRVEVSRETFSAGLP